MCDISLAERAKIQFYVRFALTTRTERAKQQFYVRFVLATLTQAARKKTILTFCICDLDFSKARKKKPPLP